MSEHDSMEMLLPEPQAPPVSTSKKVSSACQRCRQQKLKCDVQRPCTLCLRSGVTCSAVVKPTRWKNHIPRETPKRSWDKKSTEGSSTKRARRVISPVNEEILSTLGAITQQNESADRDRSTTPQSAPSPWVSSSAAVQFMGEAFNQHDINTPVGVETSAFSASQWTDTEAQQNDDNDTILNQTQQHARRRGRGICQTRFQGFETRRSAEVELISLLPQLSPATLLVDNYFKRIHWFVLVFHQSEFREAFRQLYEVISHPSPESCPSLGFLAVFSAVCVVSLSYIDADQSKTLSESGVEEKILRQQLLTTLRYRLLDIVSLGSVEAVQACVLVGSFYIYHGEPELAWPICGCGLRIAQALNLHRQRRFQHSGPPDLDNPVQRAEETRKRCWWAVYELETFCSMLYGFPPSINDDDCDVELLDPYPLRSKDPSWNSIARRETGQASLLSYKFSMVQLSIILKSTLTTLYRPRRHTQKRRNTSARDRCRVHDVIENVSILDRELHTWYKNLPSQLRMDSANSLNAQQRRTGDMHGSGEASTEAFEEHLFRLQALSLNIAFENARMLIHRPLLSYKMVTSSRTRSRAQSTPVLDPCQRSIQTCRDAALKISKLGSTQIFKDVANTYAVSFVSLHLLTAAISLSILASLNPLSQESHESKMGIRRLMEMQSRLKVRSIIAGQGLGILKKLVSLLLSKEAEEMVDISDESDESPSRNPSFARQSHLQTGHMLSQDPALNESPIFEGVASRTSMPGSISTSETNTTPAFDFYEDPTIAQVLADFGDVLHYAPNTIPAEDDVPFSNTEQIMEDCFSGQDQGWIWSFNYQI